MSYAPSSISKAATYLVSKGWVNSGIVGNTAHVKGYHLGKDRIYDGTGPGVGDLDYSVKTARDKLGLTNAASALDISRGSHTTAQLYAFNKWLVAQCQKNAVGTSDVREIIYTPDGVNVWRYDRERGITSAPTKSIQRTDGSWTEGDPTHLWHTHVSFYRDSELRDKTPLFAAYYMTQEEPVITAIKGEEWKAKNGILRAQPNTALAALVVLPVGTIVRSIAEVSMPSSGYSWRLTEYNGQPAYLAYKRLSDNVNPDWDPVVVGGDPAVDAELNSFINRTPDGTPFSAADVQKAKDETKAKAVAAVSAI